MSLELIPDDDERLHTKTGPFNVRIYPNMKDTVDEMFALMRAHDGIGLAAPQVGMSFRFFIMDIDGTEYVCINPRVAKKSKETEVMDEGCLSYPGQKVLVERAKEITVSYQNLQGMPKRKKLKGLAARCFLHELDHLNGVVMSDVGTVVKE